MYSLKIITTEDGSSSIYIPELNETYHSVHGAITESKHVFIKNGLRYLIGQKNPAAINILEIGMGTGLNVLLTVLENRIFNLKISYTAIEAYPLPEELISQLNYVREIGSAGTEDIFSNIHTCDWNVDFNLSDKFIFRKVRGLIQDFNPGSEKFDLIYYDAFAPGKQPEIWDLPVLQKIVSSMNSSGIMVTYTAKGQLKRDLKSLGLKVETVQGPPGKKEMTRAVIPFSAQ
jgi:tRNA U34 5-methylaminomethyl-2-thiouridine-forming methyltransferase MnmC